MFPNKATQFKQGQSGNPNGRKKGQPNLSSVANKILFMKIDELVSDEILNNLRLIYPNLKDESLVIEICIMSLLKKIIINSDVSAFKELMDRSFGKIPDIIESDNRNSNEITFGGFPVRPETLEKLTYEEN